MRQYEATAKTKEEAIEIGLQELGVSIGDVDVLVVEEGSKGLFGLFGSRPVKVRLTVKETEEDPLGNLLDDKPAKKAEKKTEKPAEKKTEKKPAVKAEEKKPAEKKPVEKKAEKAEAASEEKEERTEIRTLEKPEVTMIPADQL
ncbi:MAG: Jag N-terminal domain-containing protein, partial [Clostridia bacterium]